MTGHKAGFTLEGMLKVAKSPKGECAGGARNSACLVTTVATAGPDYITGQLREAVTPQVCLL